MSERYAQIGIKGAMCVVVLLMTVWEMAAPTEATTGESLTAEQTRVTGAAVVAPDKLIRISSSLGSGNFQVKDHDNRKSWQPRG